MLDRIGEPIKPNNKLLSCNYFLYLKFDVLLLLWSAMFSFDLFSGLKGMSIRVEHQISVEDLMSKNEKSYPKLSINPSHLRGLTSV
jgi:hypothetical protein